MYNFYFKKMKIETFCNLFYVNWIQYLSNKYDVCPTLVPLLVTHVVNHDIQLSIGHGKKKYKKLNK